MLHSIVAKIECRTGRLRNEGHKMTFTMESSLLWSTLELACLILPTN